MPEVSRFESEHLSLKSMFGELESMMKQPSQVEDREFATLLRKATTQLVAHFRFEEEGELFRDIAAQSSSYDRRIAQLLRQHRELQDSFEKVLAGVDAGETISAVSDGLRQAISGLWRHERDEVDLVQEALLTDIDAGD